jgi:hypothetical protein
VSAPDLLLVARAGEVRGAEETAERRYR